MPENQTITPFSTTDDERYMRRCLQIARCGLRRAAPNPSVGALIVGPGGRILGEGYTSAYGGPHAEVNAFAAVRAADEPLLRRATMYVSLEPCSHYGHTPPCCDLIIRRGVPRVVVGCVDPFAQVRGRGIARMRQAGIRVDVGVLQAECLAANRRFVTANTAGRPFVTLKWAQSADGFIDDHGRPTAVSSPFTFMLAHKLRAEHDAIVVGRVTDDRDHPQLNVRHWWGPSPRRVVLSHPATPASLLAALLADGCQSVLVEGGARTLQSFLDAGLWDLIRVETAEGLLLGGGTRAPRLPDGLRIERLDHYGAQAIAVYSRQTLNTSPS